MKLPNSPSLFTIIGVLLGVSADQVIELSFGLYDRVQSQQQATIERQHANIERIIEVWNADGTVGEKAVFTGVLVQSGMVPPSTACSLVAYALSTEDRVAVFRSLASTFPAEARSELFVNPECNLTASYTTPVGLVEQSDSVVETGEAVSCPSGRVFTQFGSVEHMDFGRQLQSFATGRPFEITAPEHIDGFDTENVVVRYFDREKENAAAEWHDYLERVMPEIDFKYAYVPGFDDVVGGRDQFELWWPQRREVPSSLNEIECLASSETKGTKLA
ncbi:MAG: hypothetical protein ACE360_04060 [Hyphomicrobiales bacterium]